MQNLLMPQEEAESVQNVRKPRREVSGGAHAGVTVEWISPWDSELDVWCYWGVLTAFSLQDIWRSRIRCGEEQEGWPNSHENELKYATDEGVEVGGISRRRQRLGIRKAPKNQWG